MIVIPSLRLSRGTPHQPTPGTIAPAEDAEEDPPATVSRLVTSGFSRVHLSAAGSTTDQRNRLLEVVRHSVAQFQVELPESDEGLLLELLAAGAAWATVRARDAEGLRRCAELADAAPGAVIADLSTANGVVNASARGQTASLDSIRELEDHPLAALLVAEGQGSVQDLARLERIAGAIPWPLMVHSTGDSSQRLRNLADRGVAGALLAAGDSAEGAALSFIGAEFAD